MKYVITYFVIMTVCPTIVFAQEEGVPEGDPNAQQQQQQAPPPGPPPVDPKVVRKLRMRFEREPTARDVQEAALKFFRVDPERVQSFATGAAWKALVPDLEVNFNNEYGVNDRELTDITYLQVPHPSTHPGFWREKENTTRGTLVIGGRLHWSLDRLVFNAESLDVTSLVGVQESLVREITSLYFTRRRLMTSATLNPPQDPGEQITESIRLDEITANLDALTGGYFSKEVEKRMEE